MIYIQSDPDGVPHHFDAACAMFGAMDNNQRYRMTTFEEVQSGKFDNIIPTNLFVGSVEFMTEVFSRMRIGLEKIRLPRNSDRLAEFTTMGDVRRRVSVGERLFVKPVELKLFTGFVMEGYKYSSISSISDSTEVMVYLPFSKPIVSEWRAYIHYNKVVDVRSYSGDPLIAPSSDYLYDRLNENRYDFPIAYTIDIGVLEGGENVVIEFNDMWAIGNYGMENHKYIRMLMDRYFEIVKISQNRA